jgi:hypothetical protein
LTVAEALREAAVAFPLCRGAVLNPAHQKKNDQDDNDKAQPAPTVVTCSVKPATADAAEPTQEGDDQDNQYDRANAHLSLPLMVPEQSQEKDDWQRYAQQPK